MIFNRKQTKWIQSFLFVLLSIGSIVFSHAQTIHWAKAEGSTGSDIGNAITVSAQNNMFICGSVGDYTVFNGTTFWGHKLSDAFAAKYDANGNFQWLKLVGASNHDKAKSLITDADENVYVCGYFQDTIFADIYWEKGFGNKDIFLIKLDKNGQVLWLKTGGGIGEDNAQSVTLDDEGNVYVSGSFSGSATFSGTALQAANNQGESFIAKYAANGNLIWVKQTTATNLSVLNSIRFDNQNELIACGYYSGSLVFDSLQISSTSADYDIYLLKLNKNGEAIWLQSAGGSYDEVANAIDCDQSGNIYIAGYQSGGAQYDSVYLNQKGYNDGFLLKYNSSGRCLWARNIGGTSLDFASSVSYDPVAQQVYVAGSYLKNCSSGNYSLLANDQNMFIARFDEGGQPLALLDAEGTGTEAALGIYADANQVYTIGYFTYQMNFQATHLMATTLEDIFIAKLEMPVLSLNDFSATNASILPSPFNDKLQVHSEKEILYAQIIDLYGKEIWNGRRDTDFIISTFDWSSGIYFFKTGKYVCKILKY